MWPSLSKFPRLRKFFKPPRTLQFTKLGAYAVGLTLGIGFAAMNTGNNLVYMIFGMMLGMITASGIISEMSLRGLEADWILPGELTAGKSHTLRLILRNTKPRLPSFGISAELLDPFAANARPEQWISGFFLIIPAGSQRMVDLPVAPALRGKFPLLKIRAATLFPFGFFKKSLTRDLEETLMVHPAESRLSLDLAEISARKRDVPQPAAGPGDSFWGLRDYAHGDNPRRISWRSSAKRERLMLYETERETERKIYLNLGPAEAWRTLAATDLESAISFAATLLRRKFLEGYAVGFLSSDFDIPPSSRRKNLNDILDYLSVFDPQTLPEGAAQPETYASIESIEILEAWKRTRSNAQG